MKFELTVNEQSQDGFKLKVSTDNDKELAIAKELTEQLIGKIEKISVEVKNYNE